MFVSSIFESKTEPCHGEAPGKGHWPYWQILDQSGKACHVVGVQYLMGDNLEVVWAEFSSLS